MAVSEAVMTQRADLMRDGLNANNRNFSYVRNIHLSEGG